MLLHWYTDGDATANVADAIYVCCLCYRIPCLKDDNNRFNPAFADCRSAVWALLLEKAFAKLSGKYNNLENKVALWALEVIAGGSTSGAQSYIKDEDQVRQLNPHIMHCSAQASSDTAWQQD